MASTPSVGGDQATQHEVDVEIRPIAGAGELEACVVLQHDTWGREFTDVVPTSMLQITAKMGGVVSGAFTESGELMGLVYGITGVRDGRLAHWSHMLAVRPSHRNSGVGRRLKLHQRELLTALGVEVMYWTFDPLVARNAHLNLNRLGARIDEYVLNMYGDSDSDLHRLGTDRFIARWELVGNGQEPLGDRDPPQCTLVGPDHGDTEGSQLPLEDRVGVEVPADIEAVEESSFDDAMRWRASTRRAFDHYLSTGWEVTAFYPGQDRGVYLLEKSSAR